MERATLSTIVSVLVRKGLVSQTDDATDQRQKTLHITAAGTQLCASIPDPIQLIASVAFAGVDGVGSRLLKRFAAAGIECRALVRSGKDVPDGVERVEGDILDPDTLAAAVDGATTVIHLAALFRTTDEAQIWKVNMEGTRHLIAAGKQHAPSARFLMASASNVYGPELTHPGRETDETTATPEQFASMGWHPARKLSVIHHADIATALELALTGVMDGRIVNIADESPLTAYEMAQIVGSTYESSGEPLTNPWVGHMDVTLARSLGFRATVATAYQAQREGRL